MVVGDVVNYKNYVAVVQNVFPLQLALNTGETATCKSEEVTLLMKRSRVIELFENAIIKGGQHVVR